MNAIALPRLMRERLFAQWLLLALAMLSLIAWQLPAHGAEVRWKNRPLSIVANEKPLVDFLREVVASQGITAVIDPKINGVISGRFNMQARNILDSVCTTYGLTWYYDGTFIYIDPASEARSEVLSISSGSGRQVTELLARLKVSDERFPIIANEQEGSLYVSGPKRYVDMVRQVVKLGDRKAALVDHAQVRMFPLKYAWAGDVHINRSGRDTVVPGVTSVLRSLFGRGPGASHGATAGAARLPLRIGPTRKLQLSTGETLSAPKIEINPLGSAALQADEASTQPFGADGDELPQFHADTRMNAVLVRDLPERMPQYERLIDSMDSRPRLVEIEVTIMDISTDSLDSLGIDWRLHGRHGDVQIGRGGDTPLTWNNAATETGQTRATTPAGGVFTAAIGNEMRNFLLARVSALTKTGTANFIARPKVLTLNNTEAVLENLSEVHVRVDGFQDAGLFSITAGTALRVTPLIIDERNGHSLMMSVDIQDGDLSGTTVDDIPIIRRRTVNTQAMVDENTSLLIAGFSSQETIDATTGVPLLSDVPLLGNLFKYTEKTQANLERFYLLTPRLVTTAAGVPPQGG